MAYIGQSPADKGIGLFSQDTFTGDGSTTTFDMSNVAPDGGGNDIQVFVDNVRQQEGSSNAYTLGLDGSSENKRITFTTAPAASQSIFVLNPGTKNVQQITTVSDNVVSTAKLQASAVTTAKITDLNVTTAKIAADAINATKLADDAVSEEHLDNTAITGHTELAETAASNDVLLVFDTSASVLKKITASNVGLQPPTFSSVSPTNANSGDGTGNHTFTITGANFDATASAKLRKVGGTTQEFDSVTRNSATQLTAVIAKSSMSAADDPFGIIVTNGNGLTVTATGQINLNASPTFTTSAGSLGSARVSMSGVEVNAIDPESAGNVTFELQSGALPGGITLTNTGANGGTATFTGNFSSLATNNTTFNFVLRAVDAASNTTSRAFSFIQLGPVIQSFTSSGTFSVPSGVSSVDVLVVAGGGSGGSGNPASVAGAGAGAGGLIFMPAFTVTPGGTVSVTVGDGAATNTAHHNAGQAGQDSVFGTLTAKGGGAGGSYSTAGGQGGSGGGGGSAPGNAAGQATQSSQPGNSGAYGFGNDGGAGTPYSPGGEPASGGGGGAGAAGQAGGTHPAGQGGIGKAYTIADGTTSVYYAGGGGGSNNGGTQGGQGGGGNGSAYPVGSGQAGTANRGGGGGGGVSKDDPQGTGGAGGKGVVIVKF
mgnify:CR=1 FL=1